MSQFIERRICRKLVSSAIAAGFMISVYDGEEYALKRSTKVNGILDAMFSTDSDTLILRKQDGEKVGSILLIYGNGEDVISDHSDNETINSLVSRI